MWHSILKSLHPLGGQILRDVRHTGQVAARVRQTLGEPGADWIGYDYEDNRNRVGRLLGRTSGGQNGRHDDIHFQTDKLLGEGREAVVLLMSISVLEQNRLPFNVSQGFEAFDKRREVSSFLFSTACVPKHADFGNPPGNLGVCAAWPGKSCHAEGD